MDPYINLFREFAAFCSQGFGTMSSVKEEQAFVFGHTDPYMVGFVRDAMEAAAPGGPYHDFKTTVCATHVDDIFAVTM